MSSPIHHAEDLDAALTYAPPWARDRVTPLARMRSAPPGMRLGNASGEFSGDRAMLALQRQLALDPEAVPQPPTEELKIPRPMALRLGAVTGVAALVALGIVALTGPQNPANETRTVEKTPPAQATANQVKLIHFQAPAMMAPVPPGPLANAGPSAGQGAPPSPPSRSEALSDPGIPVNDGLTLADDEIATLIKRGQDLLQSGDLASARLLLQRAAEAGSANAAVALGGTYDALVIRRLGVIGIKPDLERARKWYQKAAQLGSTEALQQLAKLDQTH